MSDKNLQILNVPISNDGTVMRSIVLYVPVPLTEAEWGQFQKVLRKMKPAIVAPALTESLAADPEGAQS